MPYFDAPPAALQHMFGITGTDLPDAAIVVGQWGQGSYFDHVRSIWPDAREIEEHSILIDAGGRRIWVSVVFGTASSRGFRSRLSRRRRGGYGPRQGDQGLARGYSIGVSQLRYSGSRPRTASK